MPIETQHRLRFVTRLTAISKWEPREMRHKTLAIRWHGDVFAAKFGETSHDQIARRVGVQPLDGGGYAGFERGYIDR